MTGTESMGAFVYMLRCADGSFYIGSATGDDLTRRVAEHQTGAYEGYTSKRLPVALIWSARGDWTLVKKFVAPACWEAAPRRLNHGPSPFEGRAFRAATSG
jgi:hypothetical protein